MEKRPTFGLYRLVLSFGWSHWRRQRWRIGAMGLTMLIATSVDATIPMLFGRLIDTVAAGARDQAFQSVLVVLTAALSLVVFRFMTFGMLVCSTLTIMRDIAEEAFHRVQRFSTDWHASSFAGATVRYITRGVWAYDSLADTLLLGIFPSFVVLVTTVILLGLHWAAMGAVVTIGVVTYLTTACCLTLFYVTPAASRSNRLDSKMSGALADAITCNAVVKSFAAEDREDQRLADVTYEWKALVRTTWMRHLIAGVAQNSISITLQAGILTLGVWLWSVGRATPGDVAYVLTTFTVIQGYLRETGNHLRSLQKSVNDMEDVAKFSSQPLGVEDRRDAKSLKVAAGKIVFDHVTFRYPGKDASIYEDFSLTIAPGEKVGLVGASGSGKSTFVKLVQRFYDVDSGRILIDGQDISAVSQASLRSAVTVVPQDPVLFHRSLAENIAYARPSAGRDEIAAAAKRARADEFIQTLPGAYDSLVGERGIKLSGGERQRIALARAVLADSAILILDEATSSLDSVSEHLLQDAVEQVTEGRTTIIIAHRLSTIQRVDRILVFDNGRIVEQGRHAELLTQPNGHYRRLFETQVLGLTGGATMETAD
ncbi:ABC transporter ATP-binding protein [Telmatospirillum sp.]|uniref:ABC transporter ATP-binding protein n=1 Tax=Telmatospirillum sp. TaxID=2079197 RepID=UPI00284794D2|nr:ABC transporter ATP-binding protein [Telmatospirillum sp.]MDR3435691.1 ABC transporter ATP-binding protein [Telmatospirillum sp.]